MGQRHQIFIKINNPYKNERLGMKGEEKVKAGKMFGRGKYTILALHHQWLYGLSALYMAAHILNVTNQETASDYASPFGERFYGGMGGIKTSLEEFQDKAMMMLQTISNPDFPRGTGIERMHFLNEPDEYGDIRKDFTMGDNNDGITIIDSIERKYCFMNIQNFSNPDDDGIYGLPKFHPVDGQTYARAYYPDLENVEDVDKAAKQLKDFEVLTAAEIGKMFPGMKGTLGLEKKKAKS